MNKRELDEKDLGNVNGGGERLVGDPGGDLCAPGPKPKPAPDVEKQEVSETLGEEEGAGNMERN